MKKSLVFTLCASIFFCVGLSKVAFSGDVEQDQGQQAQQGGAAQAIKNVVLGDDDNEGCCGAKAWGFGAGGFVIAGCIGCAILAGGIIIGFGGGFAAGWETNDDNDDSSSPPITCPPANNTVTPCTNPAVNFTCDAVDGVARFTVDYCTKVVQCYYLP